MLANDSQLMSKPENYVVKLIESVTVIKAAIGVKRLSVQSLWATIMTNLSKHLPIFFAAKQKLAIS